MTKEKVQTGSRTYLIDSIQLQDIMRYLMSRPYAEVVKLMNTLGTLNQLDPKIGADFVKKQAEEANALQLKRENIERKLLGQSEKQYDAMLKQRKVTEESKKAMEDIEAVLGEDAKNNKQYQEAQKKYNKEQLKAQKLERKRSLFQRFKDTKEEKGTGAAIGQLGKTAGEGALKGLKGVNSGTKKT